MRSEKTNNEKIKSRKSKSLLSEKDRQRLFNELKGEACNSAVNASFAGVDVLQKFTEQGEEYYWKLIIALDDQVKSVNNGDMSAIEGVLAAQIHILNHMFNKLTLRAMKQEYMNLLEPFLRLALKAQNQCRVTAESLANIKNPSQSTFVKQVNIGYNQQVNNNPLPNGKIEK